MVAGGGGGVVKMYTKVIREVYANYGCKILIVDIKAGSYDKIVSSSQIFRWITYFNIDKKIVIKKENSYTSTLQGGQTEQFERLELYLPILSPCLQIYSFYCNLFTKKEKQTIDWVDPAVPKVTSKLPKLLISSFLTAAISLAFSVPFYFNKKS